MVLHTKMLGYVNEGLHVHSDSCQ